MTAPAPQPTPPPDISREIHEEHEVQEDNVEHIAGQSMARILEVGMAQDELDMGNDSATADLPQVTVHPSGRPKRTARLPKRFRDILPPPPPQLPVQDPVILTQPDLDCVTVLPQPIAPDFRTNVNTYGIYRVFKGGKPSFTPDDMFSIALVADSPNFTRTNTLDNNQSLPFVECSSSDAESASYLPFSNKSTHLLMNWQYTGSSTVSANKLNTLVQEVLLDPEFKPDDLRGFDAEKEARKLDQFNSLSGTALQPSDQWLTASVPISLPPPEKGDYPPEPLAPKYEVKGLIYRSLVDVVKNAFMEPAAERYHITPFEEYWQPGPDSPPIRLFSELYNCDAYLQEQQKIREQTREDDLEPVIAGVMLWSDSTHLTSFGSASMWPVYLFNGNQSKYERVKPTSFAAHHLAYIPKLDDAIQDAYQEAYGVPASGEVLTHLRRDLMQAVWTLILDGDVVEAYAKGIPLEFPDGILRRLFIRFFVYGADYNEKVLLSCIKHLGSFPCPRCLIAKCDIHKMGSVNNMKVRICRERVDSKHQQYDIKLARRWIFEQGEKITSVAIKRLLGPKSLTPSLNAFSDKLLEFGFNFFSLFAPDLLHEFELGVWKAVFTHLLRILYAQGGDGIQILNIRYQNMTTFGRDTIRKFTSNVSAMKKLAARDYEDLLQCSIPAFDGLFHNKEDNQIIMDLLFELNTWHSLAKLRLHTETSLKDLERSATRLGAALRKFESVTCAKYITRELPSEEAARGRRKAALAKKGAQTTSSLDTNGPHICRFNLSTYKLHALADYPKYIRLYGTTDGTSTQTGELEHRRIKKFYGRVHKGKYTAGIAKHTHREHVLHNIRQRMNRQLAEKPRTAKRRRINSRVTPTLSFAAQETLPSASPEKHYQMSDSTKNPINLSAWLGENQDDPALVGFLDQLKDHLLNRILGREYDGDDCPFTDEERSKVIFVKDRIFCHKVLRINYTTYDMRRSQDSLNPRTHADVMLLAQDDGQHPYWYAQILGVFHAFVRHPTLSEPVSMDFVWIRWYGIDPSPTRLTGWAARRLHRIGFVPHNNSDPSASPAFGFLDPTQIIRGVHILPAFQAGFDADSLPPSITARPTASTDAAQKDYNYYYIMQFVDRDIFMRFRGGGVGHMSTREATNSFYEDRHTSDAGTGAGRKNDNENSIPEMDHCHPAPSQNPSTADHERSESDDDIYLDETIERQWREEHDLSDEGVLSRSANRPLSEDGGELVLYDSDSASEDSSNDPVWYEEDLGMDFEDVLGPEDGEGEVDGIYELGYSEL